MSLQLAGYESEDAGEMSELDSDIDAEGEKDGEYVDSLVEAATSVKHSGPSTTSPLLWPRPRRDTNVVYCRYVKEWSLGR